MTDQRDLKRRVRERMDKTGESYTAARTHVLAQRPARTLPFEVIDPVDLTDAASRQGFKCRVLMFPALAARVDPTAVLVQIRDALLATDADPWMWQLRATALRGILPRMYPRHTRDAPYAEVLAFYERAQAGIGGVSPGGSMLAMHAAGEMIVVTASAQRSPTGDEARPLIWIHQVTESFGTARFQALLLGR